MRMNEFLHALQAELNDTEPNSVMMPTPSWDSSTVLIMSITEQTPTKLNKPLRISIRL